MSELPLDVLVGVLAQSASVADIGRAARVCRAWAEAARDPLLWQARVLARWSSDVPSGDLMLMGSWRAYYRRRHLLASNVAAGRREVQTVREHDAPVARMLLAHTAAGLRCISADAAGTVVVLDPHDVDSPVVVRIGSPLAALRVDPLARVVAVVSNKTEVTLLDLPAARSRVSMTAAAEVTTVAWLDDSVLALGLSSGEVQLLSVDCAAPSFAAASARLSVAPYAQAVVSVAPVFWSGCQAIVACGARGDAAIFVDTSVAALAPAALPAGVGVCPAALYEPGSVEAHESMRLTRAALHAFPVRADAYAPTTHTHSEAFVDAVAPRMVDDVVLVLPTRSGLALLDTRPLRKKAPQLVFSQVATPAQVTALSASTDLMLIMHEGHHCTMPLHPRPVQQQQQRPRRPRNAAPHIAKPALPRSYTLQGPIAGDLPVSAAAVDDLKIVVGTAGGLLAVLTPDGAQTLLTMTLVARRASALASVSHVCVSPTLVFAAMGDAIKVVSFVPLGDGDADV